MVPLTESESKPKQDLGAPLIAALFKISNKHSRPFHMRVPPGCISEGLSRESLGKFGRKPVAFQTEFAVGSVTKR